MIASQRPSARGLAEEVAQFVADLEPEPNHASLRDRFDYLVTAQRRLHEAGLAVVAWPQQYGGRGLSAGDAAFVSHELGMAGAPEVINFVALEVVAPALLCFANEHQLSTWLPAMARADDTWCQLFSEPDAGSDLTSLATRAESHGDTWVVTGDKVWSTWAQFATNGLLLARTNEAARPSRGLSAFVVDMDAPGVSVSPLRTMTGSDEFAQVHFDRVEVPSSGVVAAEGQGWEVASAMLTAERSTYAIRRASVIRAGLVDLLETVKRSGVSAQTRRLTVSAVIAMSILDMRMADLVRQLERGQTPGADAPITKVLLTQAEQAVFAACQDSLGIGGAAWLEPMPAWVDAYLYSRASSIYGGTAQIQRNVIGERLLGLPREPRLESQR